MPSCFFWPTMTLMAQKKVKKELKKQVKSEHDTGHAVDLLDVRGKLDEFDFRTIERLIEIYDRMYPYPHIASIDYLVGDMRKKRKEEQINYNKFNLVGEQTQLRHTMCIPEGLLSVIKQAYPNIIRDKLQYRQFLKRFPRFRVSENY